MGIRTPDLLHAMESRPIHNGPRQFTGDPAELAIRSDWITSVHQSSPRTVTSLVTSRRRTGAYPDTPATSLDPHGRIALWQLPGELTRHQTPRQTARNRPAPPPAPGAQNSRVSTALVLIGIQSVSTHIGGSGASVGLRPITPHSVTVVAVSQAVPLTADLPGGSSSPRCGRSTWTAVPGRQGSQPRARESGGQRAWPLIMTWCTDKGAVNTRPQIDRAEVHIGTRPLVYSERLFASPLGIALEPREPCLGSAIAARLLSWRRC